MEPRDTSKLTSPFAMVIFGATGDLTKRKLIPALFHLFKKDMLPKDFFIIGFSRRNYTNEQFREYIKEHFITYDKKHVFDEVGWKQFEQKLSYQIGDFDEPKGYLELIDKLKTLDDTLHACVPRFFYLATPPDKYETILNYLNETKLDEGCGQGSDKWTKVMIEKPFGRSLTDAKSLDAKLSNIFKEAQIYRIDHYLAKETVQNILAFRYTNALFDPLWNKKYIDHVQITIAETLGVETRGNFYEGVGALRDMAQSHLLELMAAVAMKPQTYTSEGIRDARAKIIDSIQMIKPEEVAQKVVRGQYKGSQKIKGYRLENSVDPHSDTETYVALKLTLDDHRWEGVPFYLRTGKRLAQKVTEIAIVLKQPGHMLFTPDHKLKPNVLIFRIEPDEGISILLNAKKTGLSNEFERIPLEFDYHKDVDLPDAYERILLDAMRGDQTLFTRTDEVSSAWEFISNIIKGWEQSGEPTFPNYEPGSWGPDEANKLIEKDGRAWLLK